MRAMTEQEQLDHTNAVTEVRTVLRGLQHLSGHIVPESEDLDVAIARLENWLTENEGRWVTA